MGKPIWKIVWALNVPPRIRLFRWKVGVGALATKVNIARTISNFGMSCDICGNLEDSDTHPLFDCPLAIEIWRESEFEEKLWRCGPQATVEHLMVAAQSLDKQQVGEFVAVM